MHVALLYISLVVSSVLIMLTQFMHGLTDISTFYLYSIKFLGSIISAFIVVLLTMLLLKKIIKPLSLNFVIAPSVVIFLINYWGIVSYINNITFENYPEFLLNPIVLVSVFVFVLWWHCNKYVPNK